MNLLDKLKDITDAIIRLDEKIGFRRILSYVVLILILFCVFNFKSIVKGSIELVRDLDEEIHTEKMEKRDQLLQELSPILLEFRSSVGADRILYFEYHNSKENLVGIPFKYIDLVLQNTKYSTPCAPASIFKDINVGLITQLYEKIKSGTIVFCEGIDDSVFKELYPGTFELFQIESRDLQQAYISIPGVSQPVGMIVLEWDGENGMDKELVEKAANGCNSFVSRINGLIMSKR